MTSMPYEQTGLWRRSMASRKNDQHESAREKLRATYASFWKNAVQLCSRISADLPGLTLHDESHFTALWDRADQIAGPDLELTPLETFALGGAILLHDAANTIAAYEGGIEEIKSTPEWSDTIASLGITASNATPDQESYALFNTLRLLHAHRAERLGELKFENAKTKTTHHLIPDDQIRIHLGPVMGLIAASHHWSIHNLDRKLPSIRGSISDTPKEWIVRPVLLACLLRCADAAQLDQKRAPDFLYSLLKLHGISELHWRAQHRLSTPVIEKTDSESLLFSSTRAFGTDDVDAWWIAYDAIQVADKELRESNTLLKDLRLPTFSVKRVRNAESPARLSENILAEGWKPISAEVRISQVQHVVEMFGGDKLYGRNGPVVIRELIQNSADAIQLRRDIEPDNEEYNGRIVVRLIDLKKDRNHQEDENPHRYILQFDDDGIGMSQAALTGPLVDFGASYLGSELSKIERPGLTARSKRRIGRYGVGFFSAFMASKIVSVSSRPYDSGLDDIRTLNFRSSLLLRPTLLDTRPDDFSSSSSTVVSLWLTEENFRFLLTVGRSYGDDTICELSQIVGHVCQTLDVDVYVQIDGQKRKLIHSRDWHNRPEKWVRRILLMDQSDPPIDEAEFKTKMDLLRPIDPEDLSMGLACVEFNRYYGHAGGSYSIGGLSTIGGTYDLFEDDHFGVIDQVPMGPRRSEGKARDKLKLSNWASEQAVLFSKLNMPEMRMAEVATKVSYFGGDPTPVAYMKLDGEPAFLSEVVDKLKNGTYIYVFIDRSHPAERRRICDANRLDWTQTPIRKDDLKYENTSLEALYSSYFHPYLALPGVTGEFQPGSYLFCLNEALNTHGYELVLGEQEEDVLLATYNGPPSPREQLDVGQELRSDAVKIWAKRRTAP